MGLSTILQDKQTVTLRKVADLVHRGRQPVEVDRDDRFGSRRDLGGGGLRDEEKPSHYDPGSCPTHESNHDFVFIRQSVMFN
jgi:hypothetical protein